MWEKGKKGNFYTFFLFFLLKKKNSKNVKYKLKKTGEFFKYKLDQPDFQLLSLKLKFNVNPFIGVWVIFVYFVLNL